MKPSHLFTWSTCAAPFEAGSSVTLTATTVGNARFAGWSGACTGAASTCTVTMNSALNVQANFTRR